MSGRGLVTAVLRDRVTGAVGRDLLLRRLRSALRAGRPVGVLFVDLDAFKQVNDTAGHQVGDAVLRAVADRLRAVAPEGSVVARLGGDEFAVLVPGPAPVAHEVAAAVAADLAQPLSVRPEGQPGRQVACPASVGVATGQDAADVAAPHRASAVLRRADLAMYAAKKRGPGRVARYEPGLLAAATARAAATAAAQDAVRRQAFRLLYQPVVALPDGSPVRVEALLRFVGPDSDLLEPGPLLAVMDDAGTTHLLARVVLHEALLAAAGWQPAHRCLPVAVNLPVAMLADARAEAEVLAAPADAGVAPSVLVVELQRGPGLPAGPAPAAVRRLAAGGVGVLLDDIGSRWAAADLLALRPAEVGLDRDLLAAARTDPRARQALAGLVRLAGSLGAQVGAKGVEEPADLALAVDLGCRRAQGRLLGPPVPAAEVPWAVARAAQAVRALGAR